MNYKVGAWMVGVVLALAGRSAIAATESSSSGSETSAGSDSSGTSEGSSEGDGTTGGGENPCAGAGPAVDITTPRDGAIVPSHFTAEADYGSRCVCDKLKGSGECWLESPQLTLSVDDGSPVDGSYVPGEHAVTFDVDAEPGTHALGVRAFWGGDDGYSDLEITDMIAIEVATDGGGTGGSASDPTSASGAGGESGGSAAASGDAGGDPESDAGCGCTASGSPSGGMMLVLLAAIRRRRR